MWSLFLHLTMGRQFLTVEEETIKWEEVVANSRRDVAQTLQSLRKSELLGDEVLKQVRDCNRKVKILPSRTLYQFTSDSLFQKIMLVVKFAIIRILPFWKL